MDFQFTSQAILDKIYSQRASWNLIPCNSINLFSCLSSNLKTQASTDTFPHLLKTPAITKNAQKPRIYMFFQQMFSRISEALMKEDTTTLKALRDLVKLIKVTPRIHPRWTWTTSTTWSPEYNYTSLPFNIMDTLTFFVLEKMEKVRMVYLLLADDELKKNGYPKENHSSSWKMCFLGILLYSSQKIQKNATPDVMERAMDHLSSLLTGADTKWWRSFIAGEREKRVMWEEMKEDVCTVYGRWGILWRQPSSFQAFVLRSRWGRWRWCWGQRQWF